MTLLVANQQQQQIASSAPTPVDSVFSVLSSWGSTVQKTFENLTSNESDSSSNNNKPRPSSNMDDEEDPSALSSNPLSSNKKQQQMMEKRSLIRNQDFSSEDEEMNMGMTLGSFNKQTTGGWMDSFQNIKNKLLAEEERPTSSSPTGRRPESATTSTSSGGFADTLSSAFSSIKNQTTDKWGLLRDQFFEQPIVEENDNSFLGRISKEFDSMITLSAKQRMYGFFMSLGLGLLCIIIALGLLPSIIFASGGFAFFYTFGNLLCLISTLFLGQLKNMAKPERVIPSILFVSSMVLTLLVVFTFPAVILIIILVIIQGISLAWYIISYIPFAQQIAGMGISALFKLF